MERFDCTDSLLFRSGAARVSSPRESELLLRAVDRGHVSSNWGTAKDHDVVASRGVVLLHAPDIPTGAEDIRAMAVRGAEAIVESGEPVDAFERGGELRGVDAGGDRGVDGARALLLGGGAGALPSAVRDAVPATAHQ